MLIFLTVLVMLMVAYAQCREGLFTAATVSINIILAGLVSFQFWEPLADELDVAFAGGMLAGYEDAFVLTLLFTVSLVLLRLAINKLVPQAIQFPGYVQQAGGAFFGLLNGYLVAGFLVCVLQTLPWHENFLDFSARSDGEARARTYLPPDRFWLALMRHAGAAPLTWRRDPEEVNDRHRSFDDEGTFELRYLRYRRYGDNRQPLKYAGELDRALNKEKPR